MKLAPLKARQSDIIKLEPEESYAANLGSLGVLRIYRL